MPVISVPKDELFARIGRSYTDKAFDSLIFDFGLELDEISEEEGKVMYKVEIPANRYDLLCLEGLAEALKIYQGLSTFRELEIFDSEVTVIQDEENVRPHIVSAIIHDINFTEESYRRFIDYQDKLHSSIGRNRKLASIGTYDLDKVTLPVYYKNMDPSDIRFAPLNTSSVMEFSEIIEMYRGDAKMLKFVKYLDKFDRVPVLFDSSNIIMSLPPIINSDHSKITLKTKRVFIDVTGGDYNTVNTTLKLFLYAFRGKSAALLA